MTSAHQPENTPFLYLAPIRGITDAMFRTLLHQHFPGFDSSVAPFINPQRHTNFKEKLLRDVLPEANTALPTIPQLLQTDPQEFLILASRLEDLGYSQLNWNIGCPAPMVTGKNRGSGFLPFPDKIIAFLDSVLPKLRATLSIKTRLGFREKSELLSLLPRLDDFPLDEIIIHTRLGKQMYRGSTDPDSFARCLTTSRHRLVYNGDITSHTVFKQLQRQFPSINRWMIGRGALADPFLPGEIKGYIFHQEEKLLHLKHFHDALFTHYQERLDGPAHILGRMKQIWCYLIHCFPGQEKTLKKITKAKQIGNYQQIISSLFTR